MTHHSVAKIFFAWTAFFVFAGLLVFPLSADAIEGKCEIWPAWKNFRHNFVSDSGRVIDRSTPVIDRSTPQDITTSEGQAYALMFALIANDRASFELILRWTEDNLAGGDLTGQLPAWQWGRRGDDSWGVIDSSAASDADLWITYALNEAGRLWKIPKYTALAELLAARILREETAEIPGLGLTLLPGPKGFHPDEATWRLNPSYLPMQIMRRFAAIYPKSVWNKLAASSLEIIIHSAPLGFVPEWVNYQAGKGFQIDSSTIATGSFNAIRVYLWAGMLDRRDPAYSQLLKKLAPMGRHVSDNGVPPREIDISTGASNGSGTVGFSAALLPFLKASKMASALRQQIQRVLALYPFGRTDNYYDQVLALFGQGWIEERYKFDRNGLLKPRWICIGN